MSAQFFNENFFIRLLRFLNLLEPEYTVLSVSKIYMWMMLFVVIFVLLYQPTNLTAVLAATGGQMMAMANYSYKKYLDYTQRNFTKKKPYSWPAEYSIGT